jgi:hypothetical protein
LLATALGFLVALLLFAGVAHAASVTVDFDDLAHNTELNNQYRDSAGVFFREEGDGVIPEIKQVGPAIARSGSNVVDISECAGCESFTPIAIGRLTESARTVSAFVGVLGSLIDPEEVTLTAFDSSGSELASDSVFVAEGDPFDTEISVTTPSAVADVAYFRLNGEAFNSASVGFDDLTIVRDDAPPPPDFNVSVGGGLIRVKQGDFVDVPIGVNRVNGSDGDIELTVTGLPSGVSAEFTPNPIPGATGEATMRVSASDSAPLSEGVIDIEITGTPSLGAGAEPRSSTAGVVVQTNCTRLVLAPYIDARTDGCMRSQGPGRFLAFEESVRLNGLLLAPAASGARLVIDRARGTLTSEGYPFAVTIADLPGFPIFAGPIDWDLGGDGTKPKQVTDIEPAKIPKLGSLPVTRIAVSFTRSADAQIDPTVKLGFWPFDYFGAVTAKTGFSTDNDRGSDLNSLAIKLDKLVALGLELRKIDVRWKQGGTWSGQATAKLMFASPYSIGAGFGIKDGDFDFLKGSVGGINVPVGPGVFMQKLGFEVARNPFALTGTVGLSAGPSLAGEKAVTIDGALKAVFDDPFVVEVKGGAKLADRFKLADALVRYSSNGTFTVGGKAIWDVKVAKLTGEVSGFVDGTEAASLEGSVKGCIKVPVFSDPCAGAQLIASNIGIAACLDLSVVSGGIAYYWNGKADLFGGTCDLGPWRPTTSATTAADGTRRFSLKSGLPGFALAVQGAGGAPTATLSGPGGVTLAVSPQDPFVQTKSGVAILGADGTTYFYVKRPSAGSWTLRPGDGTAISAVRRSFGLPRAKVRAKVRGRKASARRTLRWKLRRIAGQRVRFVEIGPGVRNVIETTRKARGKTRFRPTAAPARKRRVVAYVEQRGMPREKTRVASFRTLAGKLTSPRGLRLKRRKSGLRVHWRPGVPRTRHAVRVSLSNGRKLVRVAGPKRRSVVIRGAARDGARVTVTPLTDANGRGPSASARLRPAAPLKPKVGRWRLNDGFGFTSGGRMKLGRGGRLVKKLIVGPGATADPSCGKRKLRVKGRSRIKRKTIGGSAFWGFGKRRSSSPDGLEPRRVKVQQGRKRSRASLKLRFSGPKRGEGQLQSGDCRLVFDMRR